MGDRTAARAEPDDRGGEPTLAERIFREQLNLVFEGTGPLLANVANAAVVAALLWPVVAGSVLLGWTASVVAVVALRFNLRRRFRSAAHIDDPASWGRAHAIGAAATGLLWGATGWVVLSVDALAYHMLIGLTASGMVAGGMSGLSAYRPSCYGFILAVAIPMAAAFLLVGDMPHAGLGIMTLVFAAAMIWTARTFNRSLLETLRLRFVNADLVRDLSIARDMAEQVSRSNWETLAHLSHELRTPLNAIGGFAEIMRTQLFGSLGNSKYQEYARDICDSAMHLTSLVDEILLYSRGHTGALRLDEAIVDTTGEAASCVQMVAEAARIAHLELSSAIAPDLPLLRADPVKLRQILLNLLSNAIKFTPPGGRVSLVARVDGQGAVVFVVTDTGIGMDRADLPRVMEPYVQLEHAFVRKRRSTGLGLGLPIVKQLVDLHGGAVFLDSELGRGTVVTVRLPPERSITSGDADMKSAD